MKTDIVSALGDLKRTSYCGRLTQSDIGKTHTLMGWVANRRDLGGVIFLDLRDREGIMQVVVDRENISESDFNVAEHIRDEYVICVQGIVEKRSLDTINEKISTGTIDLRANSLKILSISKTPPFPIDDNISVRDDLRLKYRYLDLRRPRLLNNLKVKQRVLKSVRDYLENKDFLEVETPMLIRSTPEGARDFLVPSRLSQGKFYALPQSPQIYKQVLMVAGVDRYFQLARCFRDEDLRSDRQPEFTQVDMELSFVSQEDVISMLEGLFSKIMRDVMSIEIPKPFPRLSYFEAMEKYGSDKPDIRFGLEMVDITDIAKTSSFKVFADVVSDGGVVKAINVPKGNSFTRKQIEDLTDKAVSYGGSGMAWIAIDDEGNIQSVLTKYFKEEELKEIFERVEVKNGDMIIFCAEKTEKVYHILGSLRLDIADILGLRDNNDYAFLVVDNFPLLEYDEESKRYLAMHHPFTMPLEEDMELLETSPGRVRAKSYDIVLNGVELGSGSIRIHNPNLQAKVFEFLNIDNETASERFGFMLDAFEYGTPPHGGFAFGVDRLVMLMVGAESIRETIAFPKTRDGSCLMSEAPSDVSRDQLEDLGLAFGREKLIEESERKIKISSETIDKVADLSMISITDEERVSLSEDLKSILEFSNKLDELDTQGVKPLNHIFEHENILREDDVIPSLDRDLLMRNAKSVLDGQFYVPKIIEGE